MFDLLSRSVSCEIYGNSGLPDFPWVPASLECLIKPQNLSPEQCRFAGNHKTLYLVYGFQKPSETCRFVVSVILCSLRFQVSSLSFEDSKTMKWFSYLCVKHVSFFKKIIYLF